jgi:hypothetical protein
MTRHALRLALAVAIGIAWLCWLLRDYVWHHARLVLLPAVAAIVGGAVLHPSFDCGLGIALLLLREGADPGPAA